MDKMILNKIYNNEYYLKYLREHPKWYYYLDEDVSNFKLFEQTVKKEYKISSYDKLEKLKTQINFFRSIIEYFSK